MRTWSINSQLRKVRKLIKRKKIGARQLEDLPVFSRREMLSRITMLDWQRSVNLDAFISIVPEIS